MPPKKSRKKITSQKIDVAKEYKQNFLTNVIIRIDFPNILELEGEAKPDKFQKELVKNYPILEEQKSEGFMLKLNPENSPEIMGQSKYIWVFLNKDRDRRISLSSNFLSLEFFKYHSFTEFKAEFKIIFETLIRLYPIGIINRLGLRYINEVKISEGNSLEYTGYLDKNLIGLISNFIKTKDNPLRIMHLLSIKGEEGILNFQFGIFNPEYPNSIARKEFILDYDYFSENDINPENIERMVLKFNEFITKWFEKSINSKLRALMNNK